MHYAKIDKCEYTNGSGCGVSLYVSGCHFQCEGCFNSEAWDFNYGELWNRRTTIQFFDAIKKDYIKRVSFLGGEPLADANVTEVFKLIQRIKLEHPDKQVWLYTGYKVEEVFWQNDVFESNESQIKLAAIMSADYVVDGRFEIAEKDLTIPFRGSRNQRILSHDHIEQMYEEHTSAN